MTEGNGSTQQPPQIPLQPLNLTWRFLRASGNDGSAWVLLELNTPQGSSTYWFPQAVFEDFLAKGRKVTSGIIVPTMILNPEAGPQ